MNSERIQSQVGLRRSACEKSESGRIMLHVSMIHAAHHHWPNTRFHQYCCSTGTAPYQPMKNSTRYAQPTTIDVNRQSFAPASRWFSVT